MVLQCWIPFVCTTTVCFIRIRFAVSEPWHQSLISEFNYSSLVLCVNVRDCYSQSLGRVRVFHQEQSLIQ